MRQAGGVKGGNVPRNPACAQDTAPGTVRQHSAARSRRRDLRVEVVKIHIPTPTEFKTQENADYLAENLPLEESQGWWDIEPDNDDFEPDGQRSDGREGFEDRPSRAGMELLAMYLPFHFYPEGHWGVRFFERPLKGYADRLFLEFRARGRPEPRVRVLKMAAYAVARHEFHHYLTELEALDMELSRCD